MLGMRADIGAVVPAAYALGRFGGRHDQLDVRGTETSGNRIGRRSRQIVLPLPGSLYTQMCPPDCRTMP